MSWRALLAPSGSPCLTLSMPCYGPRGDLSQDRVRLLNLTRDAEQRLGDFGIESERVKPVTDGLRKLAEDRSFWLEQSQGVAIFVALEEPTQPLVFPLPYSPEELVAVARRYSLRPLWPLLSRDRGFYLLALSLKDVRLFAGDAYGLRALSLEGVPTSFEEALGYEQYDTSIQVHSSSAGGAARQPPIVHGHGDADQERLQKDIEQYFRIVAEGIEPLLDEPEAPLLLATVEENAALYRRVNNHPALLDGTIPGSPDHSSPHELERAARQVLMSWYETLERDLIGTFGEQIGKGRVAQELSEVVQAADQGRVETLLLDQSARLYGTYDSATMGLEVASEPSSENEDLLDLLVGLVLERGGTVLSLSPEQFPGPGPVAALLRY